MSKTTAPAQGVKVAPAVLAKLAGDRAPKITSLSTTQRHGRYMRQNGRNVMTARQMRRLQHKYNRTLIGQSGGAA